jgi:hypothetical protein
VRDLQALLQKEERGRVLSLEEWLQPVIEEMDPEAAIESQYKKINTDKVRINESHSAVAARPWALCFAWTCVLSRGGADIRVAGASSNVQAQP